MGALLRGYIIYQDVMLYMNLWTMLMREIRKKDGKKLPTK